VTAFVGRQGPAAPAIIDAASGTTVSHGELATAVAAAAARITGAVGRGLVFHCVDNSVESIVFYLACLEARCPVCLLEPGPAERLAPLLAAFEPDAILLPPGSEVAPGFAAMNDSALGAYQIAVTSKPASRALHDDLALLLTTSGSTGSRKLVRLTLGNLEANARSIIQYLGIEPDNRSAQSLPIHYSYGLSLVNSHLMAGAAVVLLPWSVLQREFWAGFDAWHCTALAGVPFLYETLHRLRFDPRKHASLKTLTQAGGPLGTELVRSFNERSREAGARFFVMYGQTEATARIAYVPPERLSEKPGAVGIAIPNGRLSLAPLDGMPAGELIYEGPNVMMGYAESASDLALGNVQGGVLQTGDLAEVDDEGFYFLRGRLKRFAKLFGKRINLEDIERDVEGAFPVTAAVMEHRDGLRIVTARRESVDARVIAEYVARALRVPPAAIRIELVDALPLTSTGKKDYQALTA
jgi:acyl-CoA synthetase (AMP-forming)/AMP-acid ligase II